MNTEKKNYYDVLEIPTNSTLQEIHNAYIRAKNAYSGDSIAMYSLMSQDECNAVLEQIEEAYSVLGVAEKRREYDKVRGLNQEYTQEGFQDEISKRPDYQPNNSLQELLTEERNDLDLDYKQKVQREEFRYNQAHSAKNEVTVSKVQAYKKFNLTYDKDNEFEQEIENCTEYTGPFLQKVREYKNVTIERLADMTKISKTYIRNIESEEISKLPADVYTRGFVYQYAKCLKLNPDLVATSYIHHLRQLKNAL